MEAIESAWAVLKDFQAIVPGVQGPGGMNTPITMVDRPELQGRRWSDRFLDPGTKQQMRAYKLQQKRFQEQMRDYFNQVARARSGTAEIPKEPLFEVGPNLYPVSEHVHRPSMAPRLIYGVPQRQRMTQPEHINVRQGEVLPTPVFGPGGALNRLGDWFGGVFGSSPQQGRSPSQRAMWLQQKLDRTGSLYPTEWEELRNHYATMNPALLADAARKRGLVRERKSKKDEEEPETTGGTEDSGSTTDAQEAAARLVEQTGRKRRGYSGEGLTGTQPEPKWHETFSDLAAPGFKLDDPDKVHTARGMTYGKKLGDVWGDNFTLDPPESGKHDLEEFVTRKLFAGDEKAGKYYKQLEKVLPHLSQAEMVKWLRSHPGWEDEIPDDFAWKKRVVRSKRARRPVATASSGTSLSAAGDDEISASVHQVDPLDYAWAILKIER